MATTDLAVTLALVLAACCIGPLVGDVAREVLPPLAHRCRRRIALLRQRTLQGHTKWGRDILEADRAGCLLWQGEKVIRWTYESRTVEDL